VKVAVIGAGISGLVTAFRLRQRGVETTVFEASAAAAGNIRSERRDGFLLEYGPNTFLANRNLYDLISGLGLLNDVVPPRPSAGKRYIVRDGCVTQLPSGPAGLFSSKAFSAKGKLQLLGEPFRSRGTAGGESVYDFFARRFGLEIADYAADPFIAGIYAGDPRKLSIEAAFPRLFEYEQTHGSVIRGALFTRTDNSAKPPKGFPRSFTFHDGVATVVHALCSQLGDVVVLDTPVFNIAVESTGYRVTTKNGERTFDSVVISTPAYAASSLVSELDHPLAQQLASVFYPPIAVVITAFRAGQVAEAPSGFGLLVPAVEKRPILGVLFNSSAFGNRAPAGYHLYTTFIGGSRNAELCDEPQGELASIAVDELDRLFGIKGEPALTEVKKWDRAIPQYNVGYENVLAAIEGFRVDHPGIFFCSNFYKGISVGDCVKNADATAALITEYLDR
jgi:oxygen-dependent protoporphyrinogen oxidase